MSNVFTLDSLREEVDKKFAPVKIGLSDGTEVVLRSVVRLKKATRESVLATLKELESIGDSDGTKVEDIDLIVDAAEGVLKMVADRGDELVAELDGDLHLIMQVLNSWTGETQPGEALNSPA